MKIAIAKGVTAISILAPIVRLLRDSEFIYGFLVPMSRVGWFFFDTQIIDFTSDHNERTAPMFFGAVLGTIGLIACFGGVIYFLVYVNAMVWDWAKPPKEQSQKN